MSVNNVMLNLINSLICWKRNKKLIIYSFILLHYAIKYYMFSFNFFRNDNFRLETLKIAHHFLRILFINMDSFLMSFTENCKLVKILRFIQLIFVYIHSWNQARVKSLLNIIFTNLLSTKKVVPSIFKYS